MRQTLFLFILALVVTVFSLWWHRPPQISSDFNHQPRQMARSGSARLVLGKKISINEAKVEDFLALPGIGPERAASIVAWREKHGPFRQKKDLKNVPGIGPQLFERLSPFVELVSSN